MAVRNTKDAIKVVMGQSLADSLKYLLQFWEVQGFIPSVVSQLVRQGHRQRGQELAILTGAYGHLRDPIGAIIRDAPVERFLSASATLPDLGGPEKSQSLMSRIWGVIVEAPRPDVLPALYRCPEWTDDNTVVALADISRTYRDKATLHLGG